MLDDDDWQEMPVVREGDRGGPSSLYSSSSPSSSGDEGSRQGKGSRRGYSARNAYLRGPTHTATHASLSSGVNNTHFGHVSGATNATGTHLDIDDARGYDWRARPDQASAIEGVAGGGQKDAKKKKKQQRRRRKKEGEESSSESSDDSSGEESNEDGAKGYTQVRLDDDVEAEDLNAATDYLFTGSAGRAKGSTALDDVDASGATPHSQLNTTKNLLTEGQKIAYVGLVSLAAKQLIRKLERVPGKDLKIAIANAEEWRLRVMARMYQHMEIEIGEQKMIESLAEHGVFVSDLAPSLITTQIVDNPDFDPEALLEREAEEERERERKEEEEREAQEAKRRQEERSEAEAQAQDDGDMGSFDPSRHDDDAFSDFDGGDLGEVTTPRADQTKEGGWIKSPVQQSPPPPPYKENDGHAEGVDITSGNDDSTKPVDEKRIGDSDSKHDEPSSTILDPNTATRIDAMDEKAEDAKVTAMGLTSQPQTINAMPSALEGVTTELSSADRTITLDLRWTVLCDLFLVLTADSVYDSRSRVLLELVAEELGLTWMDVTKFEKRVTDALEIEESVSGSLKGKKAVRKRAQMARKRRMVMMGLATVGGGLVIGLSAGLMAPLIGAGLGAALGTIGIGGTTGFLSGVGGAAIITSTGVVGGGALGGTGMGKRMRAVQVFEFKPIHNNKRVNCIITVPGFMSGPLDDARLPFSVVDSIMGDIFSLLWEPDMMQEMGNAIYLLWNETLVQGVQQILAATIAGGLVGALAWPLWLTKLGYFIDNPWSNALDRAHSCGLILADVLAKRKMGVRPITLVGFSLGARVIFYALVELARTKKFGIVQNVYLIGAPITANDKTWREARGVVAGRFVNAYSRTDWILGWLFRATTGGLGSIAGLRPMERVPEVENVDVTQTVPGHLQYRAFMPLVLDQLGFRTTAEYFDEPEDLAAIPEREIIYDDRAKEEQDLKLKTVKTQSGGFGKIFRRKKGDGGSAASDSGTDSNAHKSDSSRRPSVYEYDDDDLPPREDAPSPAAQGAGKTSSPTTGSTSSLSQADETERILAELRESGIVVRELESSLPPLVAGASSYHGARRGSKLKESISLNADDDDEDDEDPQSSADKKESEKALPRIEIKGSDDDEPGSQPGPGSQEAPSDDKASAALPVEPSPDSSRQTPSKPYAKKFGSTAFDADGLPPSAPSISPNADVSLSFGDAYANDDFEEQQPEDRTTAGPQGRSLDSKRESTEHELEVSGSQYGLSAEAARELAKQFESAGMSSSGAHAAAQIAQNFEAIERTESSDDALRPSVPLTAYNGFGVGQGGMGMRRQSGGGGSAAGYGELDPWGAVGPSSNDVTPQAIEQDNERSLGAPSSVPQASSASQNSVADNPWG